ncbi:hypothetical protein CI109_104314 [Kwoniella shandongensis]|uniref:Uncharacterized protein n=1 Tax=Kwoniella shandongensis TaxID=1734106 RepID=A0A5M6C0C1_9TREE|nr:uncharacterized protein CI109_004290 [Kwoniella shandongensis]KAA5527472.1 hypothetical protein CI109_004290 [Kwoniella shandongensis]
MPFVTSTTSSSSPSPLQAPRMAHILVPESPLIDKSLGSPDHRTMQGDGVMESGLSFDMNGGRGSSRGLNRTGSYKRSPEPRFLNDPSPSTLLPLLEEADMQEGNDLRTKLILRYAIRWGVERGDVDLIAWLVGLEGHWADVLDIEVSTMEDEEGWGIVGMAINCSCGRQEMEECVRSIVGRWGLEVGPRGGRDRTGWTPLHLAALLSTPPLISFLLGRGASPHALTNRGLTPLDLVVGMPDREDVALFLEHATSNGQPSSTSFSAPIPHFPPARQKMLDRRRRQATRRLEMLEANDKKMRMESEREQWLRESARFVDVDPDLLIGLPIGKKRGNSIEMDDTGLGWVGYELDLEAERQEESESEFEDDEEPGAIGQDTNMLVFSLSQLPAIFDILITDYTPHCQPLPRRTLPANAIFLYARFALYQCDETWLEELLEGAVQRIEQSVYRNVENLAHLAFWAYNCSVLLHLLRSDRNVQLVCEEMGLLTMLEELIHAIHVFVIRVAERRIDAVLEGAILDYETLEDFNDVKFEGEWSLFRSLAPKKKREVPKASSIFVHASPGGASNDLSTSPSGGSPFRTPARNQSLGDLHLSATTPRSISRDSNVSGQSLVSAVELEMSPARMTDILSGVLLILQLYEVNPAIVVQAFSQIFFWISCELFNKIITRKKYLCRSKAIQIRMNITVLDDWVRANGLPSKTATKHLGPVTQLLQWLQCLSSVREFDTLIDTMQNMKSVNPLQMRRAVRDYRYEVNEGKMTEECAQYLAQLQRDWERRRIQLSIQEAQRRRSESENSEGTSSSAEMSTVDDDSTPVDALFDGTTALADFTPQSAPECQGELLDSRYMLPFLLPRENEYLVATPPTDAAFHNIAPASPFITDGSRTSRPPSRSSFSSSRPMGWALPKDRKLRELPPDFFKWLKDRQTELRLRRDDLRPEKRLVPALDPPLGPSQRVPLNSPGHVNGTHTATPTPTKPSVNTNAIMDRGELLSPVQYINDDAPLSSSPAFSPRVGSSIGDGSPSPALRSSKSINELRERSKLISSPIFGDLDEGLPNGGHVRSESYELKLRLQKGEYSTPPRPGASQQRQASQRSVSTMSSMTVSDGGGSAGKKKWWKLGSSGDKRKIREGSEDTIRDRDRDSWGYGGGGGDEDEILTPVAIEPGSAGKKFWG